MILRIYRVLCLLLLAPIAATAQEPSTEISNRIAAIDAVPEAERASTLAALQKALAAAKVREGHEAASAKHRTATQAAPDELEKLQNQTQEPIAPPGESIDLPELEARASEITTSLATARERLGQLQLEDARRTETAPKLPEQIAKAKAALAEIPDPAALPTDAPEAERALHLAAVEERSAAAAEIAALEAERDRFAAEAELIVEQKRSATGEISRLSAGLTAWQTKVDAVKRERAEATAAAAAQRATDLANRPDLLAIAKDNERLALMRSGEDGLSARFARARAYRATTDARRARIREHQTAAQRRFALLDSSGIEIDSETGALLRSQRGNLASPAELQQELAVFLRESAESQFALLNLEAEVGGQAIQGEAPERAALQEERRTLRSELIRDFRAYNQELATANESAKAAIDETAAYALLLDERLLWIRSVGPLGPDDIATEASGVRSAFTSGWLRAILSDLRSSPLQWIAAFLLLIGLLARHRAIAQALRVAGEEASAKSCTSFLPTLKALAYSLLLAAPMPLLFGFLWWRTHSPPAFEFAFGNLVVFSSLVSAARMVTLPGGIVESHFRFEPERVQLIHRNLNWFYPIMLPLVFFASALPKMGDSPAAGRLFFIAAMVCGTLLMYRTLHPSRGLVRSLGKKGTALAKVAYFFGVGIPVALAVGAAVGFFFSVLILRAQASASLWLVLATLFVGGLLLRWILVSRRALAYEEAASQAKAGAEQPVVDVVKVEEQTKRLVRAGAVVAIAIGLWAIWASSLPALTVLDKLTIWPGGAAAAATETVNPIPESLGGAEPVAGVPEILQPADDRVSLQDVLVAIVLLALTYVAARNIPGLLELTFLRRLSLPPGGSYAFTTTVRYVILLIGLLVAFGQIGITWSKVQWIAAAITLGIGFGLQEVFANFVAGLILLFERPIRLGDVVTVGNVSGEVTKIQIRATTIRQFNSRELIVPNKEFITGQLVNWTLTDSVLRLEIAVGIAYGSDTELAEKLLLEAATAHPLILDDPKPGVVFNAFGDSALDFQLRAHVGDVDHLLAAKNALHFAIDKAFREAEIEIAFPQTDVHIRTMPERDDAVGE